MDRPLVNLEDKLGLNDTDKAIMTIAMHTNPNHTNLLNVNQMMGYFNPILHAYTYGKHDYNSDIDGVADYQKQICKYFGLALYDKLMSSDYRTAKNASDYLQSVITNYRNSYAKKHHISVDFLKRPMYYYNFKKSTWDEYKNILLDYQKTLPENIKLAKRVLDTETETLSFEDNDLFTRLDILRFSAYFIKHPNTKFIPNHNATMADPIGIPDGTTPKECKKNTLQYFKNLSHEIPMTPKMILNYCNTHLSHLNNQIKAVAKRHPRIHYKKYLTNDLYKLEYYTKTDFDSFKYEDMDVGTDAVRQCGTLESALISNDKNYHWVLKNFALLKMNYINLKTNQLQATNDNNSGCSFASDILGTHQLSNSDTVADYFNYTKTGQKLAQNLKLDLACK